VSSAGLVLAALIGALVACRRTRRAQRTIQSLQSLSVIKTSPIMIVGALLGALTANTFGFTLQLFAYGLMIAMALEQTLIDFCTHRLARGVTMRAALAGGPLLTLAAINIDETARIATMFGAFVSTLVFFLALSLMSKGGIGSGDVRLAPVLAMFLGWMGWSYVYIGLASGFVLGGIWALALMIMGKANRSSHIPFGPFLCVGAVATLFAL
jgi:leader peptidase (prepilin peptidase) / N-methyltransferase